MSCLLRADGTVRWPSGLFTPQAAHSKSASCWSVSVLSLNLRTDLRSCSALLSEPSVVLFCGAGNTVSCAHDVAENAVSPTMVENMTAARLFFFMFL